MKPLKLTASIAVGLVVGLLVACGGTSNADSGGPTMAQFNALKAQVATLEGTVSDLQATVADLKATVKTIPKTNAAADLYLAIKAPNVNHAANARHRAMALGLSQREEAANPCTTLGTLTGHPRTSSPIHSNALAGISCTGYLFTVSAAAEGETAYIQPFADNPPRAKYPDRVGVYFTTDNCTGTAYLRDSETTAALRAHGGVFARVVSAEGLDDPNAYFYVPANAPVKKNITTASRDSGGCEPAHFTMDAYKVLVNDPSITGIDSAPIPGPVLAAPPGTAS
jgi:hypothetical protein